MKTNSQVLGNLAATAKRTRSALHSLKDELLRKGLISEKDAKLLVDAGAVLARATPSLDRDKVTAKRKEEEYSAHRKRMTEETRRAVEAAFKDLGVEDTVAFLIHLSPSMYAHRNDPVSYLREYFPLKSEYYPHRDNDVLRVLSNERNDAFRGVVDELAWRAGSSGDVAPLVAKVKTDFEAKRPDILRRMAGFIAELNTAAVAQALHKANKPNAGADGK